VTAVVYFLMIIVMVAYIMTNLFLAVLKLKFAAASQNCSAALIPMVSFLLSMQDFFYFVKCFPPFCANTVKL
jgi:hypothetical protein